MVTLDVTMVTLDTLVGLTLPSFENEYLVLR